MGTPIPTPIAIGEMTTKPPGNTAPPTFETTFGSTPTVSSEISAPPTLPRRSDETKQLGSNNFRPHYVYTSRVKTQCTRESLQGECVLRCVETTMVYDGDTLMSETLDDFASECPDTASDFEDEFARVGAVKKGKSSKSTPSDFKNEFARVGAVKKGKSSKSTASDIRAGPDTNDYRSNALEASEFDIIDSVETSDVYNGDRDGSYNDYP